MSTVLGLSVAKDQAIGDATEDRDVAKAKTEDGLVDGVVGGVQDWLKTTISARALFRIASIGFNAAKGVVTEVVNAHLLDWCRLDLNPEMTLATLICPSRKAGVSLP
jgi:hypothetical protein